MYLPEGNDFSGEIKKTQGVLCCAPVHPADFIILAVGIVIAVLGIAALIALIQHRRALCQHIHQHKIAHLAISQRTYLLTLRFALKSAVPAAVIVIAITIVFTIGFVMFPVITDEVVQRETFITGDVMDIAMSCRYMCEGLNKIADYVIVTLYIVPCKIGKIIPVFRQMRDLRASTGRKLTILGFLQIFIWERIVEN